MGAGRISALVLGLVAVLLGSLLLQEPFTYSAGTCPPEELTCREDGVLCPAPLFGEPEGDEATPYTRSRCNRGRAWRWAIYGGLCAVGAVAVLSSTAGVPLVRRARRRSAVSV